MKSIQSIHIAHLFVYVTLAPQLVVSPSPLSMPVVVQPKSSYQETPLTSELTDLSSWIKFLGDYIGTEFVVAPMFWRRISANMRESLFVYAHLWNSVYIYIFELDLCGLFVEAAQPDNLHFFVYLFQPFSFKLSISIYQFQSVSFNLLVLKCQFQSISFKLSVSIYQSVNLSVSIYDNSSNYQYQSISFNLWFQSVSVNLAVSMYHFESISISFKLSVWNYQFRPISCNLSATVYQFQTISCILSALTYQFQSTNFNLSVLVRQFQSI